MSVVTGTSLLVLGACNFGSVDVKKAPPPEETSPPPPVKTIKSGTLPDDGVDPAATSTTEVACGYQNACRAGTGCCVNGQGAACGDDCDDGFLFRCAGPSDCAEGTVCCLNFNVAACAKSCDELVVCESSDDCGEGSTCNPETCNGAYNVAICRPVGLERQTLGCGPATAAIDWNRDPPNTPAPDPGPQP